MHAPRMRGYETEDDAAFLPRLFHKLNPASCFEVLKARILELHCASVISLED